jgi:hypothetical protein
MYIKQYMIHFFVGVCGHISEANVAFLASENLNI